MTNFKKALKESQRVANLRTRLIKKIEKVNLNNFSTRELKKITAIIDDNI